MDVNQISGGHSADSGHPVAQWADNVSNDYYFLSDLIDLIIFCTGPKPFQKTIITIIVILIIPFCSLFCLLVVFFHCWCEFLNLM